jgi:hypothetical protein
MLVIAYHNLSEDRCLHAVATHSQSLILGHSLFTAICGSILKLVVLYIKDGGKSLHGTVRNFCLDFGGH